LPSGISLRSENSKRSFLFFAIAGTNVHPSLLAGFTVGWGNLVIDGGDARRSKGVQVTQRALVMAVCFRDLFLSQGRSSETRSKQRRNNRDQASFDVEPHVFSEVVSVFRRKSQHWPEVFKDRCQWPCA